MSILKSPMTKVSELSSEVIACLETVGSYLREAYRRFSDHILSEREA